MAVMLLCESLMRVLCSLCEGDMHGTMRRDRGEGKIKKHMLGELNFFFLFTCS